MSWCILPYLLPSELQNFIYVSSSGWCISPCLLTSGLQNFINVSSGVSSCISPYLDILVAKFHQSKFWCFIMHFSLPLDIWIAKFHQSKFWCFIMHFSLPLGIWIAKFHQSKVVFHHAFLPTSWHLDCKISSMQVLVFDYTISSGWWISSYQWRARLRCFPYIYILWLIGCTLV